MCSCGVSLIRPSHGVLADGDLHRAQQPERADQLLDRDPGLLLEVAGDGEGGEHDGEVRFDRVALVVYHTEVKMRGPPTVELVLPEFHVCEARVCSRPTICGGEIGDRYLQTHSRCVGQRSVQVQGCSIARLALPQDLARLVDAKHFE
jgi:hypothetical protein